MPQMGQKRTRYHSLKSSLVRLSPKADKRGRNWLVREVPIADIARLHEKFVSADLGKLYCVRPG